MNNPLTWYSALQGHWSRGPGYKTQWGSFSAPPALLGRGWTPNASGCPAPTDLVAPVLWNLGEVRHAPWACTFSIGGDGLLYWSLLPTPFGKAAATPEAARTTPCTTKEISISSAPADPSRWDSTRQQAQGLQTLAASPLKSLCL